MIITESASEAFLCTRSRPSARLEERIDDHRDGDRDQHQHHRAREPRRLVARDRASLIVSQLLHSRLLQLNHATQKLEPALAERWTVSDDKLTYTFSLRQGVTFSDGAPFTANDVLFSFRAIYDRESASPLADVFTVDGKPIDYRAADAHTVILTLPAPLAPLPRLLNSLPIMPGDGLRCRCRGTILSGSSHNSACEGPIER